MAEYMEEEYDRDLRQWEKQMDADAAYLNSQFNQGFYFGSRDQARQHKWYVLLGLIAGGVLGWML